MAFSDQRKQAQDTLLQILTKYQTIVIFELF
jgi:hypothetical protein